MRRALHLMFFACMFLLVACAGIDRSTAAAPADVYEQLQIVDFPNVRYWGDALPPDLSSDLNAARQQSVASHKDGSGLHILALSGGGADGAFGAGVLNGWSASGKRPQFDVVTGISTGALIAPFAFLGPEYDANLKQFYTGSQTKDLARPRILNGVFKGGALFDTRPLRAIIKQELTDAMIDQIADEHAKGRRLFLGTTNLDAERPVIWDIGKIAAYRTPEARVLVRDVIWASSAIPILFPPVRFKVTDGKNTYNELHTDGGVSKQIFVYNPRIPMRRILREAGLSGRDNRIWVIHNNQLNPQYKAQNTGLVSIGMRSIDLLIKSQSGGDLARIAALGQRDGFGVLAMFVPAEVADDSEELFDQKYMTRLFEIGLAQGKKPDSWDPSLAELF